MVPNRSEVISESALTVGHAAPHSEQEGLVRHFGAEPVDVAPDHPVPKAEQRADQGEAGLISTFLRPGKTNRQLRLTLLAS